jgi:hypothetical protein
MTSETGAFPPALYTIWAIGLGLTLLVFVPLAVYLLHSTWRGARGGGRHREAHREHSRPRFHDLGRHRGAFGRGGSGQETRHRGECHGVARELAMLLTLTLITVALVVVALAGYLIAIVWCLNEANKSIEAIANGLEAVAGHTEPLAGKLTTINGALGALLGGLRSADGHLGRAARVFRLI